MLNWIWLGLIAVSVFIAGWTGDLKALSDGAFESTKTAVTGIVIPLIGTMALWLGMMRLAERAGLVQSLAWALSPLLRWLFPDVPRDHPAMGSMVMNMAANMLGLGNAATPLGLRAMRDLQTLNAHTGTATNAMCMFLAINTSSIQLLPVSTMNFLYAAGSSAPEAIVSTALLATLCSTAAAVMTAKLFERFGKPQSTCDGVAVEGTVQAGDADETQMTPKFELLSVRQRTAVAWTAAGLGALGVILFMRVWQPEWFGSLSAPPESGDGELRTTGFAAVMQSISLVALPLVLLGIPCLAAAAGVRVYEEFVEGAKEGFEIAVRVIPYLVAILLAAGMFRAVNGFEILANMLNPILAPLGFPAELLPLALIRPLSGSGANGVFVDLIAAEGPDSIIARMAATLIGSTETTFYVIAVYFGAVGIRNARHALPSGLLADLTGVIAAVAICRAVFPGLG